MVELVEDKNSEEVTIKELRERAIELGMVEEEAATFMSKKSLVSVIKIMKSKVAPAEAVVAPVETPKEIRKDDELHQTKANRMHDHLEAQPKIRIKIPLDIGGKEDVGVVRVDVVKGRKVWTHVSGGAQPVTLNGYTIWIPKGKYWDVPQQIADVIGESDRAAAEAGKEFDIDRIDPKTGRPVRDSLSQ